MSESIFVLLRLQVFSSQVTLVDLKLLSCPSGSCWLRMQQAKWPINEWTNYDWSEGINDNILSELVVDSLLLLDLVSEAGELFLMNLSVVLHLFLQGSLKNTEHNTAQNRFWSFCLFSGVATRPCWCPLWGDRRSPLPAAVELSFNLHLHRKTPQQIYM